MIGGLGAIAPAFDKHPDPTHILHDPDLRYGEFHPRRTEFIK